MLVKAKDKVYYDRRERLVGEEFEIDDRDSVNINILITLGKIELVKKEQVRTVAMKPEPEPAPVPVEQPVEHHPVEPITTEDFKPAPEKKRYYRRRDMRPQE